MSTISVNPSVGGSQVEQVEGNFLTHTRGFLSWALTLDHKRIGLMYLVGVMGSFLLGVFSL